MPILKTIIIRKKEIELTCVKWLFNLTRLELVWFFPPPSRVEGNFWLSWLAYQQFLLFFFWGVYQWIANITWALRTLLSLYFFLCQYLTGKNKMTILLPYFVLFSSTQFLNNNNNKKNPHTFMLAGTRETMSPSLTQVDGHFVLRRLNQETFHICQKMSFKVKFNREYKSAWHAHDYGLCSEG